MADLTIESYCKENNILQLSLFYFGMTRPIPKRTIVEWIIEIDSKPVECKLECICKYGVPSSFDQDVYTGVMRVWVERGMSDEGIELHYSDIARVLNLKQPKAWVTKIKKSLKKLAQARYELTRCFVQSNGKKQKSELLSAHFSLFDSASLFDYQVGKSKKNGMSKLYFPKEIRKNLECKYYQFLDMKWYRALPSGLPRRLYEYLEKRRYHGINGVFSISEETICRWLPIRAKKLFRRKQTLEKISQDLINAGYLSDYYFDKNKKQCVFTYAADAKPPQKNVIEIEIRAKNKIDIPRKFEEKPEKFTNEVKNEQLIFACAIDWMNNISYFHKAKRQEIISCLPMSIVVERYTQIRKEYEKLTMLEGKTPRPNWVYKQFMSENKPKTEKLSSPKEKTQTEELQKLLEIVKTKRVSQKLHQEIERHLFDKGFEYVKTCILYANQRSRKNYSSYLQQVLVKNWAEEWAEEEKEKIDKIAKIKEGERNRIEAEKREEEQKQHAISLQPLFLDKLVNIDNSVKLTLWDQAEKSVPAEQIGRSMNVKIEYAALIFDYINARGEKFPANIISDLGFVREISDNIGF